MNKLPHVSDVLRPWINTEWVKDEHLLRGQKRHGAFAAYLLGGWSPRVDPQDEGQYRSFCSWADRHVLKVIAVEITLADRDHGFVGTLDAILQTSFCPCLVPDWKPGSTSKTWRPQIAAYRHLAIKNGYPVERAGFLQPSKDGGTAKLTYVEDSIIDFSVFLSALNTYRYFNS